MARRFTLASHNAAYTCGNKDPRIIHYRCGPRLAGRVSGRRISWPFSGTAVSPYASRLTCLALRTEVARIVSDGSNSNHRPH